MLDRARRKEPENHQLTLDYASLCLQAGRLEETGRLLAALPRDVRDETEALQLQALLDFSKAALDAPSVEELERSIAGIDQTYEIGVGVLALKEGNIKSAELNFERTQKAYELGQAIL